MRDRAPSSNNRRPAPGALPRSLPGLGPTRTSPRPCGAGQGGGRATLRETAAGRAGLLGSVGPFICKRGYKARPARRPHSLPHARGSAWLPHGPAQRLQPGPTAPRGPAPGPAAAACPPRALRAACCAWASCTAVPAPPPAPLCLRLLHCPAWAGGGSAHSPRPPRPPGPSPLQSRGRAAAPRLQRVLGAGSAHTPQPPAAGCPCCASPFPFCIPGRGASALRACLLLKPLRAGEGSHRTPAPLSCLGEGETEPTQSRGAGSPPQCQPRVGAGLGRRRAPSSPGTWQPGGGRGKAALLGLKLGKAGGGRGEVPGLPAGERGS